MAQTVTQGQDVFECRLGTLPRPGRVRVSLAQAGVPVTWMAGGRRRRHPARPGGPGQCPSLPQWARLGMTGSSFRRAESCRVTVGRPPSALILSLRIN
jgi:hypothetical protein